MDLMQSYPLLTMLPLLAGMAGLFAFAFAAAKSSRQYALGASLAISLVVALLNLLQQLGGPVYLEGLLLYLSFGLLLAQVVAAPLLDRARLIGLVGGTVLASFALMTAVIDEMPMVLPRLARGLWLLSGITAACLVGLIGSALVPTHPARAVRADKMRAPQFSHARDAGLLLFAASFVLIAAGNTDDALSPNFAVAAVTAALWPLLFGHGRERLHRAAEGVLAACVLAVLSQGDAMQGLAYGVIAAVLVERGDRMAAALRLDDPARLVGTLLLPAMAGMLLPFVNDVGALADALRWLGASLLMGGAVSFIWLVVMATVGLAALPSKVREGLDFL